MRQIAAEELDIAPERIVLQTGDTDLTPNEGYTAGSQSIQFGGVALRLACAEVRALFLDHAAASFGYARADLAVRDGAITRGGAPTGQDYWSLAGAIDLSRPATGRAPIKAASEHRVVGGNAPRVDLAAKVFGEPIFAHDMALDGMVHARVVRQPRRGAAIKAIDETCDPPGGKGPGRAYSRRQLFGHRRRRRNRRRSRRRDGARSRELGRGRCNQPIAGGGAVAAAAALDRPADRPAAARRAGADRQPAPGDLFEDARRTCLGGAVLRARPLPRRASDGVDPFAGGLSAARRTRPHPEARSGGDFGQARAGAGLLRP